MYKPVFLEGEGAYMPQYFLWVIASVPVLLMSRISVRWAFSITKRAAACYN